MYVCVCVSMYVCVCVCERESDRERERERGRGGEGEGDILMRDVFLYLLSDGSFGQQLWRSTHISNLFKGETKTKNLMQYLNINAAR